MLSTHQYGPIRPLREGIEKKLTRNVVVVKGLTDWATGLFKQIQIM